MDKITVWIQSYASTEFHYNTYIVSELGKLLLLMGALIALVGVALIVAGRFHLPLGRLPGDLTWRGKNTVVYFPLGTSILLSILLSLILFVISRFRK
ncbi:MAG TPA: DUF2905 domain-containing protein [Terriglobales bacterium]|nr:DUF2905 domain-containing protein [Terriglobales bacterium]